MEIIIVLVLAVLAFIGGAAFKNTQKEKKSIEEAVERADKAEQEGKIHATLEFADRVKKAEESVAEKIDARPVTDDAAADLADRVSRRRRRRRSRRQRASSEKPAD